MLEGIILAGGRGERFWPVSRQARPKQFLRLFGEESLLQATWRRLRHELPASALRVVAGADLEAPIRAQLPELGAEAFLAESVGRNTAPAAAVAAALGVAGRRDPLQLVVPSDHWIPSPEAFWKSVTAASAVADAADHPLVTFGIPITRPETGYGYIERGPARAEAAEAFQVRRFHEKPEQPQAEAYQAAGGYYWNSGIFLWRAGAFLEEVARHLPALHAQVAPLATGGTPPAGLGEIFEAAQAESIDWGVLEKSSRVAVVAGGFAWSDLGNWASWGELARATGAGRAEHGPVVSLDSHDCVLYAEGGVVATLGVENLIVVHTPEATLVLDRRRGQEVRAILRALREGRGLAEYL